MNRVLPHNAFLPHRSRIRSGNSLLRATGLSTLPDRILVGDTHDEIHSAHADHELSQRTNIVPKSPCSSTLDLDPKLFLRCAARRSSSEVLSPRINETHRELQGNHKNHILRVSHDDLLQLIAETTDCPDSTICSVDNKISTENVEIPHVCNEIIEPRSNRRLIVSTPFSSKSIVSYGLIVHARDTQRWIIIQRKHSAELLLFLRGLYRVSHLPVLLSHITIDEAKIISDCLYDLTTFQKTFKEIFVDEDHYTVDYNYAILRFTENQHLVRDLLLRIDVSKNELTWNWPKGRLISANTEDEPNRETPLACAKREFVEEVEAELPPPLYLSDGNLIEIFSTVSGRKIESRYWIYIIPHEITIIPPDNHPEVANRHWVTTEQCAILINNQELFRDALKHIQHLNLE